MIPKTKFIIDNVLMNWGEVLWGLRKGLISWITATEIAKANIAAGSNNIVEWDLSCCGKDEAHNVEYLVEELAKETEIDEEYVKGKWLYLMVLWVYENRESLDSPFDKLEDIEIAFDYPRDIKAFAGEYRCYHYVGQVILCDGFEQMRLWNEFLKNEKMKYDRQFILRAETKENGLK
jgi:hypothetical protein